MKKFIFSAITMVAFVGSIMANGEVQNQNDTKNSVKGLALLGEKMDCKKIQSEAVKYAKEVENMTDEDASTAGYMMYFWCMGENIKKMTLTLVNN